MTKKRKLRINWLHEWQVLEHGAWFEDMARQGWQLENLGTWFTSFIESEPEEISYHIDIAKKNDEIESNRIRRYQDAGWKYVTNKNHLYVFREKEVNKGREIYTNPVQQAETMEVLKKSIWRNGIVVSIATILFILLVVLDYNSMSSYQLLSNSILSSAFSAIVYLPLSIHSIGGMLHISSLIRKLKNGERLEYYKVYKGKVYRNRIMALMFVAVFILFLSINLPSGQAERFPRIPPEQLPVIQLTEVEGVELDQVAYRSHGSIRERENHFYEDESLLFLKQYRLHQEFIVPNDDDEAGTYKPSIQSNKYEAQTVGLAEKLTATLIEEAHAENPVKHALDGFDEVWVFESERYIKIIARQSVHVYDIHYQGNQSSSVFYEWLEEIGDSHSSI